VNLAQTTHEYDLTQAYSSNRVQGLWRVMTGYRLPYLAATVSLAIAALAKTGTYLLLAYFADTLLVDQNYQYTGKLPTELLLVGLGFVFLAVFEGIFSFLSGRMAAYTAEGVTRRLRNFLFDHIQHMNFTYHDKTPTGELIERCTSDVDALRRFFNDQAIGMGRVVLLFVINFVAIMRLNISLSFISIVTLPLILVVSVWFFKRVTKAYEKYQEQEAKLSTTLQENLTGVRVVKAFARQEFERGKFELDNHEKFIRGLRLLRMHALFWPISDIVCGFQMLLGFFFASGLAIEGTITVGTYLAYVGLVGWLIWPIRNLGRLIVQTSTGMVSYGRVMDIIKESREPLVEGPFTPTKPLKGEVVFNQVCFGYEKDELILKNVSFGCGAGEVVALLGSTGSGKTTLVNLLPRFYDYTAGSVKLDGIELKDYPKSYLRKLVGIVEQEPFLFSRSIRENITYGVGRDVPQEEVEAAAKAAAIHDVIVSFPDGYDTLVGEKGVTLSGGQKQRVAISRTLLKNPRLLILDDSTSSVDTETEATIRDEMQCLMQDRTTFIIAHRIQSVMTANLILVLDKGQIIQQGTHEQLVNQDGMYKKIYELQTLIEDELEQEIATAK
jgi:ATP-binding cassette subfamily B protein